MRTVLKIGFLNLFCFFLFSSCEKDINTENHIDKYYQVEFSLGGELDITQTPLTRTDEDKDWYYFQVYYKTNDDNAYYKKYAYGFFDDKKSMIINLKEGYTYKFEAGMIVDGSKYVRYFCTTNAGWASIGNSFYISEDEGVRYLHEGYLYMQDGEQYDRPNIDRFYGVTEGYTPTENGTVNIDMKRTAFAAKFVANDFTEGQLELAVDNACTLYLNSSNGTEIQSMYSFSNIYAAYEDNDYTEKISVNIIWVKSDGNRVPVASEIVSFKRNTLTTIKFDVKESTTNSGVSLNANEELVNGETVIVGGGTNTEVNPS